MTRNFRPGNKWVPAVVTPRRGPLSYLVRTDVGDNWNRHVDQLRAGEAISNADWWFYLVATTNRFGEQTETSHVRLDTSTEDAINAGSSPPSTSAVPVSVEEQPPPRYPSRTRQQPNCYGWGRRCSRWLILLILFISIYVIMLDYSSLDWFWLVHVCNVTI